MQHITALSVPCCIVAMIDVLVADSRFDLELSRASMHFSRKFLLSIALKSVLWRICFEIKRVGPSFLRLREKHNFM